MTIRTFRQYGQAYGSQPASIIATIDGVEVYSGPINTLNQALPVLPDVSLMIDNVIFSWEKTTDFSGTVNLELRVSGSPLILAGTLANYPTDNEAAANRWSAFYSYTVDGVLYLDSFSDEKIDGVSVSRQDSPEYSGQWWWKIMPGSVFTAVVHVQQSAPPPPPPPAKTTTQ